MHIHTAILLSLVFLNSSCEAKLEGRLSKVPDAVGDESQLDYVKLTAEGCLDPDLKGVRKGITLMLCDGTLTEGQLEVPLVCADDGSIGCVTNIKFKAADASKLLAANLKEGVTIGGVDGSHPSYSTCAAGGEAGCITEGNYVSVSKTLLTAANIKNGISVGGVTGSYVAAGTYPAVDKVEKDELYGPSGNDFTGSKRDIKLCKNGKGTVVGNPGTLYDDGDVNGNDSIDDYQNDAEDPNLYTGVERSNCNETNFTEVTGGIGLVPDDQQRIDASGAGAVVWDKIFQDDLTGLYFTNALGGETWTKALEICTALNGSTAGTGWRLPTQKELMQLYIDGVSKLQAFGNITQYFWSSSSVSYATGNAWIVYLSDGYTDLNSKASAFPVSCVRLP